MITKFRLAWLLSYIAIASFSAAFITPALPEIQAQFDLQTGQSEWIVSAFLLGYVLGQLIYAPIANRWGRVFALRLGLSINLYGLIICLGSLYFGNYWLLVAGRSLSALGAASGLACTFMLINEWLAESQRKTAMAYTVLSFTLSIGLAVTLGGMLTEYLNWSFCLWFLLFHGLLMLLGTRMFTETLKSPQKINLTTIIEGYKQALASKTLVIFSLVVGFCSAIGYCFSAAGPQIAHSLLQLSAAEYGYWNLLNMAGMLAGGFWAKRLLNRLTGLQVIRIGLVGCLLGELSLVAMLLGHSASSFWFFSNSLVLYLFSGLLFAGGSLIASNALSDKASASAMMSFLNMITATLAVVAMGYLSTNPLQAFVEILCSLWLLAVLLLAFRNLGETRKQDSLCSSMDRT